MDVLAAAWLPVLRKFILDDEGLDIKSEFLAHTSFLLHLRRHGQVFWGVLSRVKKMNRNQFEVESQLSE